MSGAVILQFPKRQAVPQSDAWNEATKWEHFCMVVHDTVTTCADECCWCDARRPEPPEAA